MKRSKYIGSTVQVVQTWYNGWHGFSNSYFTRYRRQCCVDRAALPSRRLWLSALSGPLGRRAGLSYQSWQWIAGLSLPKVPGRLHALQPDDLRGLSAVARPARLVAAWRVPGSSKRPLGPRTEPDRENGLEMAPSPVCPSRTNPT